MKFWMQNLLDKLRTPDSVCVEKPVYKRMIQTRIVKIPLCIIGGVFLLFCIVLIYTSIPHKIKEPFAVKVMHVENEFVCTAIDGDEIRIEYYWRPANMGGLTMKFGNTTVLGFDIMPDELLVDDTIIVSRLSGAGKRYYEQIADSTPMVYLGISNNQAESYLTITHVNYGINGSAPTLESCCDYRWDYIWADRYRFCERDFKGKLALFPVPIVRQEERAIIIDKEYRYYLVIDDHWLANDPWSELPAKFVGNTKRYWLVENKNFGSET